MGLRLSCSAPAPQKAPAETRGFRFLSARSSSTSSRCPIAPGPIHRSQTTSSIAAETLNGRGSSVSGILPWTKNGESTPRTIKSKFHKTGSSSHFNKTSESGEQAAGARSTVETPSAQKHIRRHSWTESEQSPAKIEHIRVHEVQMPLPSPVMLAVAHKRAPFSLAPSFTLSAGVSVSASNSPSALPQQSISDSPSLAGLNVSFPASDHSPSTKPAVAPVEKSAEEKATKVAKIANADVRQRDEPSVVSQTPDAPKPRKLFGFISRRRSSSLAEPHKPGDSVCSSSSASTGCSAAASSNVSACPSVCPSVTPSACPSVAASSPTLQPRSAITPGRSPAGGSLNSNASFVQRMKEKLDDLRPLMAAFVSFPDLPNQFTKKGAARFAADAVQEPTPSATAEEDLLLSALQALSVYISDHSVTVHFRLYKLFRLSLVHPKHSVALTALLFASGASWDSFANSEFPGHCAFLLWLFGNAADHALDFLFPMADSSQSILPVSSSPALSPSVPCAVSSSSSSSSSASNCTLSLSCLSTCAAISLVCRALNLSSQHIPVPPISFYHLSAVNSSNQNLLHLAILLPAPESQPTRRCCTRVLTYVVDRLGIIDINATAGNLCTPLHYAASFHRDYAIEKLLELDARTDLRECAIGCRAVELLDSDSYYDPIRAMFAQHDQQLADFLRRKRRAQMEQALLCTRLRDEFLIISQYDCPPEEDLHSYYQEFADSRKQQRRAAEKLSK